MERPCQPLLFFLARCSRNQLIRQIEFLKAENEILRKRVPKKTIHLKPDERARLIKLGQAVGPPIRQLIYDRDDTRATARWVRKLHKQVASKTDRPPQNAGRRFANWFSRSPAKLAGVTRESWANCENLDTNRFLVRPLSIFLRMQGLNPGPRRGPGSLGRNVENAR